MDRLFRSPLRLGVLALGAVLLVGCAAPGGALDDARQQIAAGNYQAALELADAALAQNPENADAHFLRGEAYRGLRARATSEEERQRFTEEMTRSYERAREFGAGNAFLDLGFLQAYGQEMNRGIEAFRAGAEDQEQYRVAADAFGVAARIMPDSTDAPLNQGLSLLGAGETLAAVEPLQEAIARGTRAPEAALYLGRIFLAEDRADEALRVLEEARERFPEDEDIQAELLNAYARTGQLDRAIEAYAEEVRRRPDDAIRRYNYGSFLLQAGRYEEAAEQLTRATELDPDNPNAFYNLGAAYINRVVALNEEAAELRPNDPRFQEIDELRRQLLAQAVVPLERARELLAEDGEDVQIVCESLFRAYAQLGRVQEAQAAAECAGIDLN